MVNINNLKNQDLLQRLETSADLVLKENLVAEARGLADAISQTLKRLPNLKREDAKLYRQYKSLLAKARFVFLFDVSESELLELIEKHLHLVLGAGYDVILNLKHYFKGIGVLEDRDVLKGKLRERILKNKHKITKTKIKISSIEQEPNIANWLKDYYSKLGIDQVDALHANQYLINDENTKKISEEERSLLKELFNIFEALKQSSLELGGLEENFVAILPDGRMSLIESGRPVKVDPNLDKIIQSVIKNRNFQIVDQDKDAIDDILSDGDEQNSLVAKLKQEESLVQSGSSDLAAVEKTEPSPKVDIATEAQESTKYSLTELERILIDYPLTSLEYKAIKEEITRIKKGQGSS